MTLAREPQTTQRYVILSFAFRQEADRWLAECIELGTATYAETFAQARTELTELVELHLDVLEMTGEREHFFEKHGIKCYEGKPPARITESLPVAEVMTCRPSAW